MPSPSDILGVLSHRQFHSGTRLAEVFGVSRAAFSNSVKRLKEIGVPIDSVPGRGYRLRYPMDPLCADEVMGELAQSPLSCLDVEVFETVDSTNTYLMERARNRLSGPSLCVAERQTGGRGRRGRHWVSPFGANLYLSLLWGLDRGGNDLSSASLVAGIAVARALRAFGVEGHGLKWPNDIYWGDRKLGGLLLEVVGEADGPVRLVVGVGINVWMSRLSPLPELDQPWTDLAKILGGIEISRNRLAGLVALELMGALDKFESSGFIAFADEWRRFDVTAGRPVVVWGGEGETHGIGCGTDESGRFLVKHEGGTTAFNSGEVSLRLLTQ